MKKKESNSKKVSQKRFRQKRWQSIKNCKIIGSIGLFFCVLLMAGVLIVGAFAITWYMSKDNNGEIIFSHQSGFYDSDLDIELSVRGVVIPGIAQIRYNLNGDDLSHTYTEYKQPIRLEVPEDGYMVYTLTATYCHIGEKCGDSFTTAYVLGKNLKEDVSLDIININSSYDNLYSYETGIMVRGITYDNNMAEDPEAPLIRGNYSQRSEDWIRDAQVIMFSNNGDVLFNKQLGIQISGNTSALADVKSMKLMGNKKYGYSKIPFDFGEEEGLYNSIKLSNGGQDHWWGHVRSSIVSRLAEQSGFDGYSPTKRVAVFLNGEFYGVYDAQINYSDSNIAKKFGLANNDLVEKYKSKETVVFDSAGIKELFEVDLDDADNRSKLEEKVDMDNYLKYYALQILWQNTDWPINNFEVWRYTGEQDPENHYTDGRWRFLIYDVDCSYRCNEYMMDRFNYDIFVSLIDDRYSKEDTSFKYVMESEYYRKKFITIISELMSGPFTTENVLKIIDEEAEKIDKQLQLWYDEKGYEDWKKEILKLKELVMGANDTLKADILKYFRVKI